MFYTSRAPTTADLAGKHILVVLWEPARSGSSAEPDATGNAALARLRGFGRVRVLLRARDAADVVAGEAAHRAGLSVHAILDEGVDAPTWGAERTVVLSRSEEADELALALSDALLVLPDDGQGTLAERAKSLGKNVIGPEAGPARAMLGGGGLEHGMDPDTGWRRWGLRWVGRTETALIALCALRRQGSQANPGERTYEGSRARLRDCFCWKWTVESHFADGWQALCTDRAQTPQAALVRSFDHFDRRATFGASGHRDIIWLGHLLAAAAVFAAVAGSIQRRPSIEVSWTVFELILLLLIGLMTFAVVSGRVQARWMAYRLAAEQLRIARMCLPLLVVPPLLARPDREALSAEPDAGRETEGSAIAAGLDKAIAAARRVVRDHGLPALAVPPQAGPASSWLRLIVADQAAYHRFNAETLEEAEHRLHVAAGTTFFFALGAVILHLVTELHLVAETRERMLQIATVVALGVTGAALLLRPRGHGERQTAAATALRLSIPAVGAILLLALARNEALLLATAAGPALAAALHGIMNRLGVAHRAAESRAVLKGLRDVLARLPPEEPAGGAADDPAVALVRVRALARDAARAMDTENQRWHGVLSRQSDALP